MRALQKGHEGKPGMKTEEPKDSQKALRGLAGAMLVGVLSVVVYAAHSGGKEGFFAIVSVGVLLAGAAAFVGGALGFLFGIPRTLQQEGGSPSVEANPARAETGSFTHRIDYRPNTNLEQISDWLTKILVGVSLTQITEIRNGLVSLTAFAAQGLGSQSQGQVFAFALLSYSAVLGFLFGYLWTRLFLAGALRVADQAALGNLKRKKSKERLRRLKPRSANSRNSRNSRELDAAALNLAYRQLNPSPDLPQVTQDEIYAAVAAASRPIKVQIFNQAWQVRSENWREVTKKPTMERTIPLFRALIQDDAENRYHMNHGQLGFALKDKTQPDWEAAERELTAAIEIRGPWNEHGWLLYEFVRALCTIQSDPAFAQDRPSDPDRKAQILEDLRAAVHADGIERILKSDPVIQKWMSMNKIGQKALRQV